MQVAIDGRIERSCGEVERLHATKVVIQRMPDPFGDVDEEAGAGASPRLGLQPLQAFGGRAHRVLARREHLELPAVRGEWHRAEDQQGNHQPADARAGAVPSATTTMSNTGRRTPELLRSVVPSIWMRRPPSAAVAIDAAAASTMTTVPPMRSTLPRVHSSKRGHIARREVLDPLEHPSERRGRQHDDQRHEIAAGERERRQERIGIVIQLRGTGRDEWHRYNRPHQHHGAFEPAAANRLHQQRDEACGHQPLHLPACELLPHHLQVIVPRVDVRRIEEAGHPPQHVLAEDRFPEERIRIWPARR